MSRHAIFFVLAFTCLPVTAQLLPEYAKNTEKSSTVVNQKTTELLAKAKKLYEDEKYSEAFNIYKPLAEQDNGDAQAYIGLMYEHGQGTKKDLNSAFKYYRLASDKGIYWAQYNLGLAYDNGRGVAKSDKLASKMFRLAALGGSIKSQELLGARYNQGLAAPQDGLTAAQWINPSNQRYIADLINDFADKLHFESPEAERMVLDFNIRCQSGMDRRYLPLFNLLLARLPDQNDDGIVTDTFVIARGDEARVIDRFKTPGGETFEQVVLQINKWGELMPTGSITTDAILNACFASYGPIWLLEE